MIGPVADVNTDPRNPVIGVRAFGATTDLVSRHTAAAVRGTPVAVVSDELELGVPDVRVQRPSVTEDHRPAATPVRNQGPVE